MELFLALGAMYVMALIVIFLAKILIGIGCFMIGCGHR